MKDLKSLIITLGMCLAGFAAVAEAPSGYYTTCEGKKGASLLSALRDKIGSHRNVGYDGLWNVYKTSDVRPNGKVWDMYSTKEWTVGAQHCGNYKNVGDCINREHSFPKSWFNEGSPMKSDAFHVYPTDGKVNGQRSNFPYGECAGGTTVPSNNGIRALGRLGACTSPGYSGKVFEPDDEYKGDFARTYFYMAACYNDKIAGWDSDMLSGNSYPAFKQWAIDVLMKWHRQDPVSQKEKDRNEAVYNHQNNRNPFIDYPDMAEHIWGTDKNIGWSANGTPKPSIATPVNGSTIDMGLCATGVTRSYEVVVRGQNIALNVSVTVSGAGFSASASTLSAPEVNSASGASLYVNYLTQTATVSTGTLKITAGEVSSTVSLKAQGVDGIPALAATEIGEREFTANWVCIDEDGVGYQLDVALKGGSSVSGYPKSVDAASESYRVKDLVPGTTYIYKLTSPSGKASNPVEVTTAVPIPSIQFLYDGDLYFTAEPGVPSEVAELLVDAENIGDPITISVTAPFELSSDKSEWVTTLPLADGQERFYLRLNGQNAGTYSTSLIARAGEYVNDAVTVDGVIAATPTFFEGFEQASDLKSYNGGYYQGDACAWNVVGALIGSDNRDKHSGAQALRMHKTTGVESRIEMAEPREHGIGTASFYARAWDGEGGDVALEISTDGGISWQSVKTFAVSDNGWEQYSATVNEAGMVRMRLNRLSGKRICIDDIELTDYAMSAVRELDYHSWDAYCRDGQLVIENTSDNSLTVMVVSPNGAVWHQGEVSAQGMTLDLPGGVYLVTVNGFTRKVIVRE